MRRAVVLFVTAACSSSEHPGDLPDAPATPLDAAIDAAECPKVLFAGGTAPDQQGWTIVQQQPATLTVGTDDVELKTTTPAQATVSGQLLLSRADTIDLAKPSAIEVVMRVDAVNNHNAFDAAAAILASFHPSFGDSTDRAEMLYFDQATTGWADGAKPVSTTSIVDGKFHTIVFAIDAARTATVKIDGAQVLTRAQLTTNGTFAIGDQTNDANVDATMRIRSITKLCAP